MADVACYTLAGGAEGSESVGNVQVDLTRVGLRADDVWRSMVKAGFLCDEEVEFVNL